MFMRAVVDAYDGEPIAVNLRETFQAAQRWRRLWRNYRMYWHRIDCANGVIRRTPGAIGVATIVRHDGSAARGLLTCRNHVCARSMLARGRRFFRLPSLSRPWFLEFRMYP